MLITAISADAKTAFRAVHTLKGVALNLGLTALAGVCSEMTEALRGMVRHAFDVMRVDVVGIRHFVGNERSRRVIERAGFVFEGVVPQAFCRFDGKVFDDASYSILREEYETGHVSASRRTL